MALIGSKFFERNLFFLRRFFPRLRHAYHYYHGINYQSLPPKQYSDVVDKVNVATDVLENHLRKALLSHHERSAGIPKTIWLYWNSPIDKAPDVVKVSIKTWKEMNPTYDVIILTDDNIEEHLGFDFNSVFHIATVNLGYAMKADILRLYLLSKYGGVWADSTSFCIQALDQWLPECASTNGLFTFRHMTNQTRPIEAWFIASEKGHFIIKDVLAFFLDHLFKDRKNSLFISNRIKTLGLLNNGSEQFGKDVFLKAEKFNFMPYFSVGYFFNDAFSSENGKKIMEDLLTKPNHHAINNSDLSTVKNSFVSKQTYKKEYQGSEVYLNRKAWVLSRL